ncbi:hypothetical protein MVEN_00856900 [Mycena venus]|uniref:Uncharacterized protein n=1 Tax=Mycena venus TaxID=2733690 RepID=A0A8H7D130_9AGAR|nr:hypothetical protein MVEN_00856900 [Mycena venus]
MNMSSYNGTTNDDLSNYVLTAESYIQESLYYLPYVDGSTSIGLTGGTLYDVPKTNAATGTLTVDATAFNVTCNFLQNVTALRTAIQLSGQSELFLIFKGDEISQVETLLEPPQPGVISVSKSDEPNGFYYFYSSIPIVDSNNNTGGVVDLDPPRGSFDFNLSSLQCFRCFLSVVQQTALLDVETKKVVALYPELVKNTSVWHPGYPEQTFPTTGNPLFDEWESWYSNFPDSEAPRDVFGLTSSSLADLYLIKKLNLHPVNQTSIPSTVTLHDLENALSELVATMFWTIGHIAPTYQVQKNSTNGTFSLDDVKSPLVLLPGRNTTANEQSVKVRLDLNIIAVSIGLGGSVVLILLSLQHSLPRTRHEVEQDLPIDGTGLLHAIWLYRNHPELELLLEQVEDPTDYNLRQAGMVRTRLVGNRLSKTESPESS